MPLDDARIKILEFLEKVAEALPVPVLQMLPPFEHLDEARVSQAFVDDMDERYFDLELTGRREASGVAFAAARFAAAIFYFQTSATFEDLMNAAYEASHALKSAGENFG